MASSRMTPLTPKAINRFSGVCPRRTIDSLAVGESTFPNTPLNPSTHQRERPAECSDETPKHCFATPKAMRKNASTTPSLANDTPKRTIGSHAADYTMFPVAFPELYTPQRKRSAECSEEAPGHCFATPKRTQEQSSTTPKRANVGPMTGICQRREVDAALRERSTAELCLALLQGHCCTHAHALSEAVRQGHVPAFDYLMDLPCVDVDEICCGQRPLHAASRMCMNGSDAGYRMCKRLLEHGASANAVFGDDTTVLAPLHVAVKNACLPAINLLLEHGADPNVAGGNGEMALHIACQQSTFMDFFFTQDLLVETLLRAGANPTQRDSAGRLPVHYAQTLVLRKRLLHAESVWSQQQLYMALRPLASSGQLPDRSDACSICLSVSDITEKVASFL